MVTENEIKLLKKRLSNSKLKHNYGNFYPYLEPILQTILSKYGDFINYENIEKVFNAKVKYSYGYDANTKAETFFPSIKNIKNIKDFNTSSIKIFIEKNSLVKNFSTNEFTSKNETETLKHKILSELENHKKIKQAILQENANILINLNNIKPLPIQDKVENKMVDAKYIATFIHELIHTLHNVEVNVFNKDNQKIPNIFYASNLANNGKIEITHSGIYTQIYNLNDKGCYDEMLNLNNVEQANMLDEAITESITYDLINSIEFKENLKKFGITLINEYNTPSYLPYVNAYQMLKCLCQNDLENAYFSGKTAITKNKDIIKFYQNFCNNFNKLEEDYNLNFYYINYAQKNNLCDDLKQLKNNQEKIIKEISNLTQKFLTKNEEFINKNFENNKTNLQFINNYLKSQNNFVKSVITFLSFSTESKSEVPKCVDELNKWIIETKTANILKDTKIEQYKN